MPKPLISKPDASSPRPTSRGVSEAEFAALVGGGVNGGHVRRAVKAGKLIVRHDGKLDLIPNLRRWAASRSKRRSRRKQDGS